MASNFMAGGIPFDEYFISTTEFITNYAAKSYGAGLNTTGQLGNSSVVSVSSKVNIGSLNDWQTICCSEYAGFGATAAINSSGELWTWGFNQNGKLGYGNTAHTSSPVQVGTLTHWMAASGDLDTVLLLTKDGTLWGIGSNAYGQYGNGETLTTYSSPVVCSTAYKFKSISSNGPTTVGVITDGSVITCGIGDQGELGNNSAGRSAVPALFWTNGGTTTAVQAIIGSAGRAGVMVITANNTLWCWGVNSYGQLGLGDVINRSSPTQVGTLTNWSKISHTNGSTLAIKTDGTLWGWGENSIGQLGLGNTVNRSSPVQVGSLTNWNNVTITYSTTIATKIDGSLWAWGDNSDGKFGIGTTVSISSPVQVGSLTNWDVVSSGLTARHIFFTQKIG